MAGQVGVPGSGEGVRGPGCGQAGGAVGLLQESRCFGGFSRVVCRAGVPFLCLLEPCVCSRSPVSSSPLRAVPGGEQVFGVPFHLGVAMEILDDWGCALLWALAGALLVGLLLLVALR